MALNFQRVFAGDLITTEYMNRLLDALDALDGRLGQLERGQPATQNVKITSITPVGLRMVGDILHVQGINFIQPIDFNKVYLRGVPVQRFTSGSTERELVFEIPDIPNLSPSGEAITLTVSNGATTDSANVLVRPQPIMTRGRIESSYVTAPVIQANPPNITPGTLIFGFKVKAFVDRSSTFKLSPTMSDAGWSAELLEDTADVRRSTDLIDIPADTTGAGVARDVRVRVTVPSLPSGKSTLTLTVNDTTAGTLVTPGAGSVTLTIGAPVPAPLDFRLSLSSLGNAAFLNNRLQLTRNVATTVTFKLNAASGTFVFDSSMRLPTGWTRNSLSPLESTFSGTAADLSLFVKWTGASGAVDTDMLVTAAEKNDATTSATYALPVSIVD